MTREEVYDMIASVGIPAAYHHFTKATAKDPPFICFYYGYDNDVLADDQNYVTVNNLTVELYTDNKDFALQASLESALQTAGLVWSHTEVYIESELMYMETYTMEVIINA